MNEIEDLARKLGFTEIRLVKLRAEYRRKHDSRGDEKLLAWLRATFKANRDRYHLLNKHVMADPYTEIPAEAMDREPEAVPPDEIANYRSSIEARQRKQAAVMEDMGNFLAACQDLRASADAMNPVLKAIVNRDLWKMKSAIDGAERKLRGRMAA